MIILAGMIGVGKTTYTSLLAKELGTTAFFEPVDNNPILDKYYEDPEKYDEVRKNDHPGDAQYSESAGL